MARKRRHRRSIAAVILVWIGRRMLSRVQKQSLRSLTGKSASKRRLPVSLPKRRPAAAPATPKPRRLALPAALNTPATRRRAGKGFAAALLTTAAVAALKVGVQHVVEAEREQQVVTPDFDVFGDDED